MQPISSSNQPAARFPAPVGFKHVARDSTGQTVESFLSRQESMGTPTAQDLAKVCCGHTHAAPGSTALARSGLATALLMVQDQAMCPICTWNQECILELGHSNNHKCEQGHRW